MRFVLLNDIQRREIVNAVTPSSKDKFSYQNLNLLTAVYDEETNSFLTCTYYLSEFIKRSEIADPYDDKKFVLLTDNNVCTFGVNEYLHGERYRKIISPVPSVVSSEKLLEMIQYYDKKADEKFGLIKSLAAQENKSESEYYHFTEEYLLSNNLFTDNIKGGMGNKEENERLNMLDFIPLDVRQVREIISAVKPERNKFDSYRNLNFLIAVCDKQTGGLLAQVYINSSNNANGAATFIETKYVLLIKNETYLISVNEYLGKWKFRNIESPCPAVVSNQKLTDMLNYYSEFYTKLIVLRKFCEEMLMYNSDEKKHGSSFVEWYLEKNNLFYDKSE